MANYSQVASNATRTIIIPKGILDPDQMNVISIPRNQNATVPLLVLPRQDGNGVLTRSLPIWNDELSGRQEGADIRHLVGVPKECRSKSRSKTYSQGNQQTQQDFSLSSMYDSSAEMDEKEANMFKNVMDGKYNVIKNMSPSPERIAPRLPEYWEGQGFRPRHLSTPIPGTQQHYMNDTSFPSTMYTQDFVSPELLFSSSEEPNPTYNQPNATFAQPNATYNQPNATFAQSSSGYCPDTCGNDNDDSGSARPQLPYQSPPSQAQSFPGARRPRHLSTPIPGTKQHYIPSTMYSQDFVTPELPSSLGTQPNSTFSQPNATYNQPNATFAQTRTGYCKPNSDVDSPVTCGNDSDDSRWAKPQLSYQSPPSRAQSFPGARKSPEARSQWGGSLNVPPAVQNLGVGGSGLQSPTGTYQNYSAAPFGIPIDATFQGSYLPYDAPPELAQTYPQPTVRQGGSQRRGASLDGYGLPARSVGREQQLDSIQSSPGAYQSYDAAPFGIPIDTRFAGSYLPYDAPPELAQSYPQPTVRQDGSQRRGASLDGYGLPARSVGGEQQLDSIQSSPGAYQNYSAAPFGIPIDTRFAGSYPLPYHAPPEVAQSYPRPTRTQRDVQQRGASMDGCGTSGRNVCTNDDEVYPRIMHMSSSSFTQINDSPIESRSFTIDAPGGVNAELLKDIVRDTAEGGSLEQSYGSSADESLVIPYSFHQPPGFHDMRRVAGLDSLDQSSPCGDVQGRSPCADVNSNNYNPCSPYAGNKTY